MKGLKAKTRIAMGQVGLLVSVILTASMLDLIPDRSSAVREGRAALAEAIAANSSQLITQQDLKRLAANLGLVVKRNKGILSAAVRHADGGMAISVGPHEQLWAEVDADLSTDTHVQVPIWAGDHKWGEVELMFTPIVESGWLGWVRHPLLQLTAFIALVCFAAFYIYLGKMLKHLDPSQAIPARVRSALDTMAEGLLVLDEQSNIVLANAAFASIVDKRADDLMGFNASDFQWTDTDGSGLVRGASPWEQTIRSGEPQLNSMVRLQLSEGDRRTFMINCSPVMSARGKTDGVLVSLDDVTELEEKELQLRKSKEKAEAANRAKSEFLANMSHEIRTPMNAILGFTEVLKRGYGKGELDSRRYLNTIHSSGKHLLELINDILDLSKVEAGRLEVERTECEPHHIVQEVVRILAVRAREKGISLTYEPEGALPETIQSDPARLRQIVTNLVGNAIKFTEKGGVKVLMRLDRGRQNPVYTIDVSDTGIGMAQETLATVFDAFVQADSSITRRFGGTGLGLAISLRFAKALGGDIRVSSESGKGSLFSVVLDPGSLEGVRLLSAAELQARQDDIPDLSKGRWRFPPRRLLVVDDGDENRELVSLVLEEAGLRVEEAANGQVGVDMAMESAYDAILMDVQMPVMDGFTATRLLREQGLEQPIIALTGNAMKGVEQECLAGGFTSYMAKPIDIDRLLGMLARILGGRYLEEDQTPVNVPAVLPEAANSLDSSPIISRLSDQDPRFNSIVERFVERLEEKLAQMKDAWRKRDFDELAALAHWLKGAAGTVGFDVFTEPAIELEQYARGKSIADSQQQLEAIKGLVRRIELSGAAHAIHLDVGRQEPLHLPITEKLPSADQAAVIPIAPKQVVSRLQHNPRLQPLIRRFETRLQDQMEAIERAMEAGDFKELANLAHWLKGAGGTLGFDVFTEPAMTLELAAKEQSRGEVDRYVGMLRQLVDALVVPKMVLPDQPPTLENATGSNALETP